MKQVLLSALVAAAVSVLVVLLVEARRPAQALDIDAVARELAGREASSKSSGPTVLSYTMEPAEDAWVDGSRTAGADHRSLAPASNAICYLTKIEIKGIRSPEDSSSCSVSIDDFTGYWQLTAGVEEGGLSQVRCNARCLVWE